MHGAGGSPPRMTLTALATAALASSRNTCVVSRSRTAPDVSSRSPRRYLSPINNRQWAASPAEISKRNPPFLPYLIRDPHRTQSHGPMAHDGSGDCRSYSFIERSAVYQLTKGDSYEWPRRLWRILLVCSAT